ncbi:MAG: hypothetical protein JNL67_14270 [Planctomycetaceae bacterium]|nr:hypothetical protein [Planctomycetaceae bacterium]
MFDAFPSPTADKSLTDHESISESLGASLSRRNWLQRSLLGGVAALLASNSGCWQAGSGSTVLPDKIYGKFGYGPGQFQKPRAIAIDQQNEIYIVDMTGRIQVFDADGNFLRVWKTPNITNGRPTGLSVDANGMLWVADTHYYQALAYSRVGELDREKSIFGEPGIEPGKFGMLTEVAFDSQGRVLIGEYGENDRIQVFSSAGQLLFQIGQHGTEPGQFMRPQCLTVDELDRVWVADSGNHRVQVFQMHDDHATLIQTIGAEGTAAGQMRFPYDLFFDEHGDLYVCEFGNHRVQKFNRDGQSLWIWESPGSGPSSLHQPWGCVMDQQRRLHVLDSYHHRVYRVPAV